MEPKSCFTGLDGLKGGFFARLRKRSMNSYGVHAHLSCDGTKTFVEAPACLILKSFIFPSCMARRFSFRAG